LIEFNELANGICLSIAAGSIIYVTVSEIITEEFTFTPYRYSKFFLFILGGAFVAFLSGVMVW